MGEIVVVNLSSQTVLRAPNDQVHHEGREEHEGEEFGVGEQNV